MATLRAEPLTSRRLWKDLVEYRAYTAVLVGIVFVCVMGVLISSNEYGDRKVEAQNNVAEARERVLTLLEHATPNQRVELAQSLLSMHDSDIQTGIGDNDLSELRKVVQDPTYRPNWDLSRKNWDEYFHVWVPLGLGVLLLVFMVATFAAYATLTCDRHEYLMDLPWQRAWPLFFILVTLVPGVLFYPISAVRLYWERRHNEEQGPGTTERDEEETPGIVRPIRDTLPEFDASPEAAAEQYRQLRIAASSSGVKGRLEMAKEEDANLVSELTDLGERIRSRQQRRNELRAEIRKLKSVTLDDEVDKTALENEFANLCKMQGVAGVKVTGERIVLLVKVRYPYKGGLYDLGDWHISFSTNHFGTREIRRGVLPTWRGNYPVYRLGADTFCFGGKDYEIQGYLEKGQFLEAIDLAIACMHSINDEDIRYVPEAFAKVGEE